MYKKQNQLPTRLITFGNYKWVHWFTVAFFLISGLLLAVFPSIFSNKIVIGTIIVGILLFSFGIFCIIDHLIFLHRTREWKK